MKFTDQYGPTPLPSSSVNISIARSSTPPVVKPIEVATSSFKTNSLYKAFSRWGSKEIVNILLSEGNKQASSELFRFEGQISIAAKALKTDSNEFWSMLHKQDCPTVICNTLRYLLQVLGLGEMLTNKSQPTDKRDLVKMLIIIRRLFALLKECWRIYENYRFRELKVKEVRENICKINDFYSKIKVEESVLTIEENEKVEGIK